MKWLLYLVESACPPGRFCWFCSVKKKKRCDGQVFTHQKDFYSRCQSLGLTWGLRLCAKNSMLIVFVLQVAWSIPLTFLSWLYRSRVWCNSSELTWVQWHGTGSSDITSNEWHTHWKGAAFLKNLSLLFLNPGLDQGCSITMMAMNYSD